MLTPKLSNPSLQYQPQPTSSKNAPPKKISWIRTFATAGLSLTGLGILSQLIYNSCYSPSQPSHSLDSISPTWKFLDSEPLADSTTFKAAQTFYNIFETKSAFFHSLGLTTSEPFGDLQAFALDGDLKALEQAYSSYLQNQVNPRMKDKLLGRVLRHMNQSHKNLTAILKWLVSIGANVNHQEKKTLSERKDASESTYTTLLTAFKNLDVDLYEYLISKGASAGMQIRTYSMMSKKFDQTPSIFESIIINSEISLQNPTELKEAYLCPIYKRIIDASFPNFSSNEELNRFRVKTYIEKIQPYFCQNYFTVTEQEKLNYDSDQLVNAFNEWFNNSNNQQTPPPEEPSSGEDESIQIFDSEAFKDATEKMKKTMDSAQEFMSDKAKVAKDKVSDMAQKATDVAINIGNSDFITSTKEFVASTASVARDKIASAAEKAGELAVNAAHKSAEMVGKIANSDTVAIAGEFVSYAVNATKNAAANSLDTVGDLATSVAQKAANAAYDICNSDVVAKAGEFASDAASAAGNAAANAAEAAGNLAVSAAQKAANAAYDIHNSDVVAKAGEFASNAASAAGNAVVNAAETAGNLAVSAATLTGNAAKSTVDGAANLIKSVSNSEAMAAAKEGLSNAASAAKDQAAHMAQKAADGAANVLDGIRNSETLASAKEGLSNAASNLKETVSSVASSLNEAATDGLQSAKETVAELTGGSSKDTGLRAKK